jgi:hypothetical protein
MQHSPGIDDAEWAHVRSGLQDTLPTDGPSLSGGVVREDRRRGRHGVRIDVEGNDSAGAEPDRGKGVEARAAADIEEARAGDVVSADKRQES